MFFYCWHNCPFYLLCVSRHGFDVPAYLRGVFLIEEIGCFAADSSLLKANSICTIGWGLHAGLELCRFRPWEVVLGPVLTIFESRLDFICSLVVIMSAGPALAEQTLIDMVEADGNANYGQRKETVEFEIT